jgi:hypothetical protein
MLPALSRISDISKPHNWMSPPGIRNVVEVYGFGSLSFSFALFLGFALLVYSKFPTGRTSPALVAYVAASFLLVPIITAVKSQFGTVLFTGRYFLPSVFGAGVLVTAVLDRVGLSARAMTAKMAVLWGVFLAFLVIYPVFHSYMVSDFAYPFDQLDQLLAQRLPAGLPVIIEDANTFMPLTFYHGQNSPRYYFPLDWETALDSRSLHATVQYKLLRNWKNSGYLTDNILSSEDIACRFNNFIVLQSPEISWFETRVKNNPDYGVQFAMELPPVPYPGPKVAWLVIRRTPRFCGGANSPVP